MLTTPLLILLFLNTLGLGIAISEHGKPKKGNYNVWTSIITTAFVFWLIYLHSAILMEGK